MAHQQPSGSNYATNLIVNYLPQTLTDQEFACIFQSVGPVKSSKIVRDKKSNYSYGFGFVDYEHTEDAIRAIETLNGLKLQNKTLKVAYARPCTEDTRGTNLYVRGLPQYMTDEHLRQTFQPYGTIVQARVLYDQFSATAAAGASKGIGFVLYGRRSESQAALEALHGAVLQGATEPLNIQFAEDNSKKVRPPHQTAQIPGWNRAPGTTVAPSSNAIQSSGGGPIRVQSNRASQNNRYNPMAAGPSANSVGGGSYAQQQPDNGGHVVFVYNIGYEADERALWELFAPYGTVTKVNVIRDPQKGQCKGYGFVTMPDYSEALCAIGELNGRLYSGNRPLQVSFKTIGGGMSAGPSRGRPFDPGAAPTGGSFYGGGGAGRAY